MPTLAFYANPWKDISALSPVRVDKKSDISGSPGTTDPISSKQ